MRKSIPYLSITIALLLAFCFTLQAQPAPMGPGGVWIRTYAPATTSAYLVVGNRLYAGGDYGIVYSTDHGDNYVHIGPAFGAVRALAIRGSELIAGTQFSGVFHSFDSGNSWQAMSSGLTDQYILTLFVDGNDLYAGTYYQGVFRWSDSTSSWARKSAGLVLTEVGGISRIDGSLFAFGDQGISASLDGGSTWLDFDRGSLPDSPVWGLVRSGPNLVAATGMGVYYANSGWNSWRPCYNEMPAANCILQVGNYLFTVQGSSVYMSDLNGPYGRSIGGGNNSWRQPVASDDVNIYVAMNRRPLSELMCCHGTRGNINGQGIVDLADLSTLTSYLTGGGKIAGCPEAANVNGIGIVDLADLSTLVMYLTSGGTTLPNCN